MKYRKKPVVIEAMQWNGVDVSSTPIINWVLEGDGTARLHCDDGCNGASGVHYIAIDTLEGTMMANAGDWIIRGVKGEFYPCKPDIFAATYDAFNDTEASDGPSSPSGG